MDIITWICSLMIPHISLWFLRHRQHSSNLILNRISNYLSIPLLFAILFVKTFYCSGYTFSQSYLILYFFWPLLLQLFIVVFSYLNSIKAFIIPPIICYIIGIGIIIFGIFIWITMAVGLQILQKE